MASGEGKLREACVVARQWGPIRPICPLPPVRVYHHPERPHRTAPHSPHRTAPHRTAPHRTAPHRTNSTPRSHYHYPLQYAYNLEVYGHQQFSRRDKAELEAAQKAVLARAASGDLGPLSPLDS